MSDELMTEGTFLGTLDGFCYKFLTLFECSVSRCFWSGRAYSTSFFILFVLTTFSRLRFFYKGFSTTLICSLLPIIIELLLDLCCLLCFTLRLGKWLDDWSVYWAGESETLWIELAGTRMILSPPSLPSIVAYSLGPMEMDDRWPLPPADRDDSIYWLFTTAFILLFDEWLE